MSSYTIPEFELRIGDALADPTLESNDRTVFETLADILRTARRDDEVALQLRNIIVLHRKKRTSVGRHTLDDTAITSAVGAETSERV